MNNLLFPHGGYRKLRSFKTATLVYDLTVWFCDRFVERGSRTRDQMEQAARSGRQNIGEGSRAAGTSKKTELKLTNVARSSLEELLLDYEDWLRQRGLRLWDKNDPEALALRALKATDLSDLSARADLSDPQIAANAAICFIHQANYLLDQQLAELSAKFLKNGGFTERLYQARKGLLIGLISLIGLIGPIPALATTTLANQFTVEFWVNPTGSVVSKALAVQNNQIRLFTDASGYVNCAIYTSDWQTAAVGTTALPLGAWSHVACTYDKANIRIFINGSAQGTTPAQTGTVNDSGNVWKIGQDGGGTYGDLTGSIDDVRFYNYARTTKQIFEDMSARSDLSVVTGSGSTAVGYWKMDEGQGTTVNNSGSGGSGLNGTLGTGSSAPTWSQSGKFGKALSFDGSNDYVDMGNPPSLQITGNIAISSWVKMNATDSSFKSIVSGADGTTLPPYMMRYAGTGNSSGVQFCIKTSSLLCADTIGTFALDTTNWHHIVGTYDGSYVRIYVDGKSYGSAAQTGSIVAASSKIIIGANYETAPLQFWNGTIDEVKIYPYALTLDEIRTDFNHGLALKMGTLSTTTGVGSSSPPDSVAAMYCVPGSSDSCAAPVAEWSFDDNSGSVVADNSGSGNTGTWNGTGTHWSPGKLGPAGKFNGSDDYVNIPHNSSFNVTDFTVSLWLYYNGTGAAGKAYWTLINKNENSGSGNYDPFHLWVDASTKYLNARVGNESSAVGLVASTAVNDNKWHFATLSRSGTNIYLYLDGIQKDTTTLSGSTTNSGALILGNWGQYGSYFNGSIDQVQIFNYARTPAQIAWDYNQGLPVAWYKFDDCEGTTAKDEMFSTSSNNNGTLTVGATGTQTSAGNCGVGNTTTAWSNGSSGKFNSSLNFDGTDDYVDIGNVNGHTDYAISTWVYPTTLSGRHAIIQTDDGGVELNDSTVYYYSFNARNGAGATKVQNAGTVTLNQWNHILVVAEGTTGLKLYINGSLISSSFSADTFSNTYTDDIIGAVKSVELSFDRYFQGQIDDVRIYNYALTPSQVKLLYNNNNSVRFGPVTGSP